MHTICIDVCQVEYDGEKFLEKNRDRLAGETINVLRASQIALIRTLFHSPITKTGQRPNVCVAEAVN